MKNYFIGIFILIGILFSCSSDSNDNSSLPLVIEIRIKDIASIDSFSAQITTTIASNGGNDVVERGVIWSTSTNPTIDLPTKTNDGTGIGTFTTTISGLLGNTTYYVRSYLTNNSGTIYSGQNQFTTSSVALLPELSTDNVNVSTLSSADCTYTIFSDNENEIIARGVVWSTSINPTIYNSSKTNDGVGTGSFISYISNLSVDTTYYIRAYATNSIGTSYGEQREFTTSSELMNDIAIGNQVWMYKNLAVSTYRNGDAIQYVDTSNEVAVWPDLTTGAWCNYQDNSLNDAIYGKLYNWYAVNDPRGLAPVGYHVPSSEEWNTLISYLGGTAVAGEKLRSVSRWQTTGEENYTFLNRSGFTGLPGGYRSSALDLNYYSIGITGRWWSSTQNGQALANIVKLDAGYRRCEVGPNRKNFGYSVRCIKD
ncbi:MAG: fibrobacter succinogenes major paralogous domain-containing protein [Flavobacterium sp.]|nr:fibrobacter succinogenes major paralogous domain-containing protein [Flavobacterium sp.]